MKFSTHGRLALFLLASTVHAASFEGRVHFQRTEPPGRPQDIMYWVKGDRNRVEVSRERVYTFMTDTRREKTTVTLEDDMAFLILPSLAPLPEIEPPELEPTDEVTRLHGYAVRKYLVHHDEGRAELWLAEGFGKYTGFGEGYQRPPAHIPGVDVPEPPPPQPWEYALSTTNLFPLRVIARDGFGREILRLEVKSITPQGLDDRLFSPSPNYREVETWPKPGV